MASVLVLARFPRDRVKRFDRMVRRGEALSRSDAVRMLTEIGYSNYLREQSLEATRKTAGIIRGGKKSAVEIAREAREEMWKKFMKKAGGDEKKAADLFAEAANKANVRFGKATMP